MTGQGMTVVDQVTGWTVIGYLQILPDLTEVMFGISRQGWSLLCQISPYDVD
jgi:uncharacterized protein YfaA (DUF2138 family)